MQSDTSFPSLATMLLENLSTAVVMVDTGLRLQYANPAAEQLLNSSSSHLQGLLITTLFVDNAPLQTVLEQALLNLQPFTQRHVRITTPQLQRTMVDLAITPLKQQQEGLLLELQPVDRLLQIDRETRFSSSHHTNQDLIRGLAHEIKNPLGGIRGAAQLLAFDLKSKPELMEYTDIITQETDRLCSLVDRLLGPNKSPQFAEVNIHEVLEHIAKLISSERLATVDIIRDYDPSIPPILGDRNQLVQALLNIVRNAVQALSHTNDNESTAVPHKPCITMVTRIQRQYTIGSTHHNLVCRIDIIDNGAGIPDSLKDKIFFPMISGRSQGSGLGLPITQSIVHLHDGLIQFNSEPGNTCFSIFLPFTPEKSKQKSGHTNPPTKATL